MSRIGSAVVNVPKNVSVTLTGRTFAVKGPKGTLSFEIPPGVTCEVAGANVRFQPAGTGRTAKALHGTARALAANMVQGCSEGFTRELDIVGVGYRAAVKGDKVDLTLGFSHPISYPLPASVKAEVKDGRLVLSSADKAVLGQVASDIRGFRPPEPYKGKGVKYVNEVIVRKEGKARGKK